MSNDILYSIIDSSEFVKRQQSSEPKQRGKVMVDIPEIDEEKKPEPEVIVDECKAAVKMAFLGAGQGGGNIADAFWGLGYRRVAVVNTTSRDMQRLRVPESNRHILKSEGGAGKDPAVGRKLVEQEIEQIYSLIRNSFKKDVEQILICVGAGGGCVDGNASIMTKEYGLVKISDLYDSVSGEQGIFHADTGDCEFVLSNTVHVLSSQDGKSEWRKIESIWKNANKGEATVISTSKASLVSSGEHPYFIYCPEEKRILEIPAKKVTEGMLVVRPYLCEAPLFNEIMWFLGYFAGNGTIREVRNLSKIVRFSHEHEEVLERVSEYANRIDSSAYCKVSKDPKQSSYDLYVSSEKIYKLITGEFSFYGGYKHEKLTLPKSAKTFGDYLSFYAGLVDSDGHIKEGRKSCDLAMAQGRLLRDLSVVLSVYGFDSTINIKTSVRESELPLTRMYSNSLQDFDEFFANNLTHIKKRAFSAGNGSVQHLGYYLPVKALGEDAIPIIKKIARDWIYGDGISRNKLELVCKEIGEDIFLRLSPVESVSVTNDVDYYDLTVEGTRSYFASSTGPLMLVHNSGTGAVLPLVKLCKEYLVSIGVAEPEKKVGVIVTLPTKDESAAVQKNAVEVLEPLVHLAETGQLSPLVLVDNARVMQLYGQASVVSVWEKANRNIAALFHVFNQVCAEDSTDVIVTCDPQDYKSVLRSGVLTFGRTKLEKVERPTDVADAIRENVKQGLLVEGMDLSKATCGAAILLASQESLAKISQESLENAFGSLNRLMKQGSETKLHRGIYSGNGAGVWFYTIISGLGRPVNRLAEMKSKAGLA